MQNISELVLQDFLDPKDTSQPKDSSYKTLDNMIAEEKINSQDLYDEEHNTEDNNVQPQILNIGNITDISDKIFDINGKKFKMLELSELDAVKQNSYSLGVQDTKNRFKNIMIVLREYRNKLQLEHVLEKTFKQISYDENYFRNSCLTFVRKYLEILLEQSFLKLSFDIEKFFSVLDSEIKKFYSEGKIIIKVNPTEYKIYQDFLSQKSFCSKYKDKIKIFEDNNIARRSCIISNQDLFLRFDHSELQSMLTRVIKDCF